jgi:predicted nucleic acid-binding protein
LEILSELTVLGLNAEAERLTRALLATGALPARAQTDAAHLAIAAAAKADYLLTWNCRHLANAQILRRLDAEAKRAGWKLPKVCTPPELMGDSTYETESNS